MIFLMQENRSFDHYFGTMRGARGFADPRAVKLPSGASVWEQPNGSTRLLPFRPDVADLGQTFLPDPPHGGSDTHAAWNQGRYDRWVPNKGVTTLTYHLRKDLSGLRRRPRCRGLLGLDGRSLHRQLRRHLAALLPPVSVRARLLAPGAQGANRDEHPRAEPRPRTAARHLSRRRPPRPAAEGVVDRRARSVRGTSRRSSTSSPAIPRCGARWRSSSPTTKRAASSITSCRRRRRRRGRRGSRPRIRFLEARSAAHHPDLVETNMQGRDVVLEVSNPSGRALSVSVFDRYRSKTTTILVGAGESETRRWRLEHTDGWYDLTIAVNGYARVVTQLAGHVENSEDSISDPIMGGPV